MQSITTEQAKRNIDKFKNEHLYNFIKQRECQDEPSELTKYAYEVAKQRLAKEHAMLWNGQRFKDEPLQDIIDRDNKK